MRPGSFWTPDGDGVVQEVSYGLVVEAGLLVEQYTTWVSHYLKDVLAFLPWMMIHMRRLIKTSLSATSLMLNTTVHFKYQVI